MKYLIVRSNRLNTFGNALESDQSTVVNMFRKNVFILQIILEIILKLHLPIPTFFFNKGLLNTNANMIIVFDGHVRKNFLRWIVKNNSKTNKFVFWCWNTVDEIERNFKLKNVPNDYEIWSYSRSDCEKRSLHYNTTFYWNRYCHSSNEIENIKNDIYFIGKDKGRMKKIQSYKEVFDEINLSRLIQVVPTYRWIWKKAYSKSISYDDVLDNIFHSKAILDVQVSSSAGPSLRALEAAFYHKKFIKDDKGVMDFKFYNPSNILILDSNLEKDSIIDFLNSRFIEINDTDLEYYNISNWLRRFNC